jgi:hypothetical protein
MTREGFLPLLSASGPRSRKKPARGRSGVSVHCRLRHWYSEAHVTLT